MKTQANAKIPGFTLLYCCSVILGGITTISTILSMSGNYIFFYLFFLIPPILQFIAFISRNNRLLLVGFYGAVCLHIIEYVSGGFLYGFDRLFSTVGSNIFYYIFLGLYWLFYCGYYLVVLFSFQQKSCGLLSRRTSNFLEVIVFFYLFFRRSAHNFQSGSYHLIPQYV